MLIEPFEVIDRRETAFGVLLDGEIVRVLTLGQNPFVARNASLGSRHVDDLSHEPKNQKANNPLNC